MSRLFSFIAVILFCPFLIAQVVVSDENTITTTTSKVVSSLVELSIPNEMYIVESNRLEIFKHSIINAINPDNYFLEAKVISGIPKGSFYDRVFIYDCEVGDSDIVLEFTIKDDVGTILDKKSTVIKPVVKSTSPKNQLNILLIRDSFTATITYPEELLRRLAGSKGFPLADDLRNINFIGTTPNSATVNREGHSGKSWSFFLDDTSPFYNKNTGQIDFGNYCSKNDYSTIDAVVIMLGTNSISNDITISSFLDKLIYFNPKIKGIVTGKILATPLGGGGTVGILNEQTFYGSFYNTFFYNRRMEDLIQSVYSENFKFVDILPSFDIIHNMRFTNVAANFRNQSTLVKQGSNNVHPADSGYLQIADIIYSALHHFILNEQ